MPRVRVGGPASTETAPATATAAQVVVRVTVAAAMFGAAAIHFAFAPDHFGESRFHGAFFFLAGWVQLSLGLGALLRPSRAVLRAIILVNVAILVVWATSRVTGLPFGDAPWTPEPVAFPDTLTSVLEASAVVGASVLLAGRVRDRTVARRTAVVGGVVLALALVGTTTASVAPALSGGHVHAASGHPHGASPIAHPHPAASGLATAGGGASHDHDGVGATAGIESGNGSSPCEQAGVNVGGTAADGHGHAGPSSVQAIGDPAVRAALSQQLQAARDAAARYPTAADAMAAGYRKVTSYIPCIAAHYMKFGLVDATFDPSQPEMLLYGGNGPDAKVVGLSYYVIGATEPDGFAGPNDLWHQHIGLCIRDGLVVGGSNLTTEQCAARGGVKGDGSNAWMVHAWVVPGWESAWGVFSGEHPELGTRPPG